MSKLKEFTKKQAIEYLDIDEKEFNNYQYIGKEIVGNKKNGRWHYNRDDLDDWNNARRRNTVYLNLNEYEHCFEFALKVVYGGSSLYQRSEMEAADNWISGILAEHGLKKFLKKRFNTTIYLDGRVHTERITARDIIAVKKSRKKRPLNLFIGVKSSKMKNAYLIADEHGLPGRSADVYIFVRVGLPRDHLFRYLRNHSFIKRANSFLMKHNEEFRYIEKLNKISICIVGYCYGYELERKKSIPGQDFDSYRYVKCSSKLKNSDEKWKKLIRKI